MYDLGQVVLDDHRSSDSFISRYRCNNLPTIQREELKKGTEKEEMER